MTKVRGRRLAISDIHGCAHTFIALLEQVKLQKTDSLYILGDMINRGKRSKKVIKHILLLQELGYSILPIRGNHEHFLIAEMLHASSQEFYVFCDRLRLTWLFDKETLRIKPKYFHFFSTLPFYYDLGDRLLSHAGFDLTKSNIFENTYAMLHQREFANTDSLPETITIIHGHTPISLEKIKRAITAKNPIVNIDNGCVYRSYDENKGNLLCIDIDSFEIFCQKNID